MSSVSDSAATAISLWTAWHHDDGGQMTTDKELADRSHKYKDPRSGQVLMSVTTVVNTLDSGDKLGAGAGAAANLTKQGLNHREVWKAKADTGTRIHAHASDWALGKWVDVLEQDEAYLDAFSAFINANKPKWIETERAVVHSAGFGGRFDLIGEIGGVPTLLDVKTGKPYPLELSLQLSGYRFAEAMIVYNKAGVAVGVEPMPYIERCGGLYLSDDGTATFVEVKADEEAFAAFLHLLEVRRFADKRKGTK